MDKELYREIDQEHLAYIIKQINKSKGKPFEMANEALADEMFPYIQKHFPSAEIFKFDIMQYIVISKRAKNILIKNFKELKQKKESELEEIKLLLDELNK